MIEYAEDAKTSAYFCVILLSKIIYFNSIDIANRGYLLYNQTAYNIFVCILFFNLRSYVRCNHHPTYQQFFDRPHPDNGIDVHCCPDISMS